MNRRVEPVLGQLDPHRGVVAGLLAPAVGLVDARGGHPVGAFGRDAVQFVMVRTPYFRAVRAKGALLKEYPEYAENKIREGGYRVLLSFLSGSSTAVFGRFRLKLPKRVAELPLPALEVEQTQQVTELMLLCIIPERLGEWDWLF